MKHMKDIILATAFLASCLCLFWLTGNRTPWVLRDNGKEDGITAYLGDVPVQNYNRMGFTGARIAYAKKADAWLVGTDRGELLLFDRQGRQRWKRSCLNRRRHMEFPYDENSRISDILNAYPWLVQVLPDYDPRAELAPRDIVSRSIVAQMAKTNSSCVYLTLKHLDTAFVHRRFPGIESICHQFDLDLAKDNIPIRPGAHYMMGGIEVDLDAKTNIEGLRAVGEVTSTGLHGANRLASNSLLEAVVFGKIAGEGASIDAKNSPKDYVVFSLEDQCVPNSGMPLDTDDIRNTLKSVMQRCVGVMRDKDGLQEANDTFMSWQKFINDYQFKFPRGWELQNMLTICRLIAHCALIREETRGGHSRSDFPESRDEWKKYTVVERNAAGDENDISEPLEN